MDPIIGNGNAGASPLGSGGGNGGAGGADGDLIKETTTQNFMADVVEASKQVPVLVDFWAPWCGPCKQLTPILEKVVREARGAVKLVKMNIDDHPEVAQQLRVQSIPAVYAFRDGQPVDGFMGAIPESQLKEFIKGLGAPEPGPTQTDQLVTLGKAAFEGGDLNRAAQAFAEVIQQEPGHPAAVSGLAQCYIANGDLERARQTLALIRPDATNDPDYKSAQAALSLAQKADEAGDTAELEAKLAENPKDHQARFDLALALNGRGDREGAVEQLLNNIEVERGWNDEAARKQLLEFFDAYGPTDEATLAGRRRLSSILFS
jgi:putative thioredoxin